ncbi:MAG: S9 family peptidase [Acidimicrobiia bacterium]
MRPDQLDAFASVGEPAISPDGRQVLVTVSRVNLADDRYDRSIHRWTEAAGLEPFTAGPGDGTPRWSPDGSRIAFLRAVDEVPQVAVIAADGGEATVVTEAPKGVRGVEWADAGRLVVHWAEWAEGWDVEADERARRPRRVTAIPYRFDNIGWTHDTRHRLTVVDPSGEADPHHLTEPMERFRTFTVDGDRVVFLADRSDRPIGDFQAAIHAVPLEGGEPTELAPLGAWAQLASTPEGLVVVGMPDLAAMPDNSIPYRLTPEGPVPLVADLDRSTVLVFGAPVVPVATEVGFLTLLEDAGRVGVARIVDGDVTEVIGGDRTVTGLDATADGRVVAFTASSATEPGELHLLVDGTERRLSDLNASVADDLELVPGERFTVDGPGGPIDAWAYLPPGDGPVPLLLNIHGGPASQYGEVFLDEFQVYASAGYGVVAANPRGSSGRGRDWVRGAVGDGWGRDDMTDLLAVVEAALERFPRLDGERMGIMGGSYGGFMTAWITARDDRWRSAVVERALLSFPSFWGTSDIGTFFTERYSGGSAMPDDLDDLWDKSPLATAHRIATPTLVLHSEADFRCPIEQAEQFFVALARAGTPTEFLRFPGESHELSRSGKPRHRVERFEAILDWHARWLGEAAVEVAD